MKYLLPFSVLLANAAGLLTQILLPRFLNAENYSEFALTWAFGQFLVAFFYEWMRYGVLRFGGGDDIILVARRRQALGFWYAFISILLLSVAALLAILKVVGWGYSAIAAACVVYAVCQGVFDGRQTLSRALGDDAKYSTTGVFRSIVSLPLVIFSAWLWGDGGTAVFALASSFVVTMVLFYGRECSSILLGSGFDKRETLFLLRYGVLIATSASVSLLLFAAIKGIAVDFLGAATAAGLLLAIDLSQKSISIVGMAVNVVVSQRAIRSMHSDTVAVREKRMSEQISVTAAFVIPAGVGFYLIQPSLAAMLVPREYVQVYDQSILLACVCGTLYAFRAFAVDALFVIAGRARFAAVGPFVTIVIALGFIYFTSWFNVVSPLVVVGGLTAGLVAGIVASILAVRHEVTIVWPLRDLSLVVAGAALMGFSLHYVPASLGVLHLFVCLFLAVFVYGMVAFVSNICGVRDMIKEKRRVVR